MKASRTAAFLSPAIVVLTFAVLSGCSLFVLEPSLTPDEYLPNTVLVIVNESIYDQTESRIKTYCTDISKDGIASNIILLDPAEDSYELKLLLQSYNGKAECGFFIGDIPPVWYEQTAFGTYEVFPTDLYYMDLDANWLDTDSNGYFDSHSDLAIDFYVSRIDGTADEINFYFDKLHNYRIRSNSTPVYDGAFIFKDDDWHKNYRNNDFGLDSIYGSVELYQDDGNTTKSAYLDKLTSGGSEYVYQWIHAFPPALFIDVDDNYEIIKTEDIANNNVKGNFYNLFDCQAARYTVNNLADYYLTQTDSCIAILGSTKTGGVYYPVEFHKSLGLGACWGAAFKSWYNTEGYADDTWFLGIITMGDPAVRPYHASGSDMSKGSRSVTDIVPVSDEEKEKMYINLMDFAPSQLLPEDLMYEIEQSLHDF